MKGFLFKKKENSKSKKTPLLKKTSRIKIGYFLYPLIVIISLLAVFIGFLLFKIQKEDTLSLDSFKIRENVYPYFDGDLNPNGKAIIVYEILSRVVVFGKNENLRFAPASTAKIMTAIIVLENYPLGSVLKAENVGRFEGSKMNLVESEEITVQNLLYGLLLPSGNDAAHVLAENFPGGETAFIKEMNNKAKELNLENTKFFDPAGFSDDNYTTAFDLARLAAFAMAKEEFKKVVATKQITVTDISGEITHELENLNELLALPGVNGIKTGFTNEAGGVLITSFVSGGENFITVVLKSNDRFFDTKEIISEIIKRVKLIFY